MSDEQIMIDEICTRLYAFRGKLRQREAKDLVDEIFEKIHLAYFENERYNKVEEYIMEKLELESVSNLENVDITKLVEECCSAFFIGFDGGPLNDDDHWIWDLPIVCIDKIKGDDE